MLDDPDYEGHCIELVGCPDKDALPRFGYGWNMLLYSGDFGRLERFKIGQLSGGLAFKCIFKLLFRSFLFLNCRNV